MINPVIVANKVIVVDVIMIFFTVLWNNCALAAGIVKIAIIRTIPTTFIVAIIVSAINPNNIRLIFVIGAFLVSEYSSSKRTERNELNIKKTIVIIIRSSVNIVRRSAVETSNMFPNKYVNKSVA